MALKINEEQFSKYEQLSNFMYDYSDVNHVQ